MKNSSLNFKIIFYRQMASSIPSMQSLKTPTEEEAKAALAIQAAFKGYKVRKEIKEIQTFYRQVSNSEDQIAGRMRPSEFRNDLKKTRQDSYLKAVGGLSPEEETKGGTTRAWKIRQDSYQQAIRSDPSSGGSKHRRQDSYQQAMRMASEIGKQPKKLAL